MDQWELSSAQARALSEKGQEYILPVRFDSTEIPGILPTVGYLDFHLEGPSGICAAMLEKLGISPLAETPKESDLLSCDSSPYAVLISKELPAIAYFTIEESSWGSEIELGTFAESSEMDAFFSRLRSHSGPVIIAYGFDVAAAKLRAAVRTTVGGRSFWKLSLSPQKSDFSNDFEMATSTMTVDQFAEKRVRRLLLNESPPKDLDRSEDMLSLANSALEESLILGLNSAVKIQGSKFPALYQEFGSSPKKFLEIAWISAIADLKLSAAVQHVELLRLTLSGTCLEVVFEGRRHRKYANVDPHKIEVAGSVALV